MSSTQNTVAKKKTTKNVPVCKGCDKPIKKSNNHKKCVKCKCYFHARCTVFSVLSIDGTVALICEACKKAHIVFYNTYAIKLSSLKKKTPELSSEDEDDDDDVEVVDDDNEDAGDDVLDEFSDDEDEFNSTIMESAMNAGDEEANAVRGSNSAQDSNSVRGSSTRSTTAAASEVSGSALSILLAKLDGMEERQERMNKRQKQIMVSNKKIQDKLKLLEELAGIPERVTAVEADLVTVRDNLTERVAKLEEKIINFGASTSAASSSVPPKQVKALTDKVQHLEKRLKEQQKIQSAHVTTENKQIVIAGLKHDRSTSLRVLAHAVVSALDSTVPQRDVVSARPMVRRGTEEGAVAGGSAEVDVDRSPAVLVTLASNALVRSTMAAKIRKGRMRASDLSDQALLDASAPPQDAERYININEYLPREVHELRTAARLAAKEKGCICYTRDGRIFIRSKDGGRAIVVRTKKDLDSFLAKLTVQPSPPSPPRDPK